MSRPHRPVSDHRGRASEPRILAGLDAACRALADGRPVVLPNASPMTYVVVATTPEPVNRLKGRPHDQNVGLTLYDDGDWQTLAPVLDLRPQTLATVRMLMHHELLSFLLPLRVDESPPGWTAPAVRDRHLAVFAGYWPPLIRIWQRFPRLFGSSANRTGSPPAWSAAEAAASFGPDALVVDGDALRDPEGHHDASTILRVAPSGELSLHRSGAQDTASGPDTHAFFDHLAELTARGSHQP